MPWVYILPGAGGWHYIGSTTDLRRRLATHLRGHTHASKRLGDNLEILASVEMASLEEARQCERELKGKKDPGRAVYLLPQHGLVFCAQSRYQHPVTTRNRQPITLHYAESLDWKR